MLETYKLKQHVETVRQELSHALYQHDAACRVIARLTQERDRALSELADTRKNMGIALASGAQGAMDVDPAAQTGITDEMIKRINELSKRLSKNRKKRFRKGRSQPLEKKEDVQNYKQVQSFTLHSPSDPGILCMSINPSDENVICTGGQDSNIIMFQRDTKKQIATLKGHKKKVLSVKHHPSSSIVLSASADKTVKIWTQNEEKWMVGRNITTHKGAVTGLSIHPLQDYFLSSSEDGSWAFHDMTQGRTFTQIEAPKSLPLTCIEWHPDGVIIATGGQDDRVRIWDVKSRTKENVATFEGHKGGICSISFSENGYYLSTSDNQGVVKLWDLRKLKNFKDLSVGSKAVRGLQFDLSGYYLACGGGDGIVKVYETKKWEEVVSFTNHSKQVTSLEWSKQADFLASVGKDRALKIYSQ